MTTPETVKTPKMDGVCILYDKKLEIIFVEFWIIWFRTTTPTTSYTTKIAIPTPVPTIPTAIPTYNTGVGPIPSPPTCVVIDIDVEIDYY